MPNNTITDVEQMSVEFVQKQQEKGRERYGKGLDCNDVPNVRNLCEELADALQYGSAHLILLNKHIDEILRQLDYGHIDEARRLLQELKNE